MRCQRAREDLLDYLRLMMAGTPPVNGCRAGSQWHKQKGFIVQWRSALSTALRSAIVRAMSADGANAEAEGALTAIGPSFPAHF